MVSTGLREMGNGEKLLNRSNLVRMKILELDTVVVAQHCKCTKCY